MTTVTVTIKDVDDTVTMEGTLDNPEAINEPPTPALVIGSYLAAQADQVCKDAMSWFRAMQLASEPVPQDPIITAPKIIVPDDGIQGAPV